MATDKRFVVKNGLQTENINFVFNDAVLGSSNITATMLSSNTLSFSGSTGQLFSITDSMTGVIFAVNDISGVPSIEVYDDGRITLAETFGNVTIGNSVISSSRTSISTTTGILQVAGGVGVTGNINAGGTRNLFTGSVGVGTSAVLGANSNVLSVYGTAMVYGNVDLANPTGGTSGIYFNDGSYQTTAFTGAATPSFGTAGTIQYAGAGNTFAGNGDNFFWDTANNRLGIGTNTPTNVLTVRSTATPAWFNTVNSAVGSNNFEIIVGNGASTGTTVGYVNNTLVPYGYVSTGTSTRNIVVSANGRVGIGGVTAPQVMLDVGGTTVIGASWAGNSNFINPPASGLAVQGSVGIGTYTPLAALDVRGGMGVTAASNFNSGLSVASLTSNGAVSGTTGTFGTSLQSGAATVQSLNSNTNVVATSLQSTGQTTVASLISNTNIFGATLNTSGVVQAASLIINANSTTSTLNVQNNALVGSFNSNTNVVATNLQSTGQSTVASLVVNTGIFTNSLNVNTTANVGALTSNTGITVNNGGISVTGVSNFTGNINVTGNLNVSGAVNVVNSNVLTVNDPIIYLGEGNPGNTFDIGLVGNYNQGTYYHTGIVRDHRNNYWTLFDTLVTEPNVNTGNINWADSSITFADFRVGNIDIMGNTQSTSSTSGVIVINGVGGIGVGGNINAGGQRSVFGGNVLIQGSNTATSATTGALIVQGGVGIGGNLHIADRILLQASGSDGRLTTTNGGWLRLDAAGGRIFSAQPFFVSSINSSFGDIAFSTNIDGGGSERMRITSTGLVGIGTTNPLSALDVRGGIGVTAASNFGGSISVASLTSNGSITGTNYLVTTASSTAASGAAIQRVFTKTVAATELYKLAEYSQSEGIVAIEIQVASQTSSNSGTTTYRFQGGYSSLAGSYYRLMPFNDGRGHGEGPDTGSSTLAWELYIYGTTVSGSPVTYGVAVSVPTGAVTKTLFITITELRRGMTFTDRSADAVITSFTDSGDIYSHRNLLIESRVGIATTAPGSTLDVNGIASFRSSISVASTATVGSLTSNGAITGTTGTFTSIQNSGLERSANIVSNTWIHATQNLTVASSNTSTSTATGALVVTGGAGVGGNLNIGGISSSFSGNVGIGAAPVDTRLAVTGSGASVSKMLSITAVGVGGGSTAPFYGAEISVGSNNNANVAYAMSSRLVSWNDGGSTTAAYAGYFNLVPGTIYGGGYGIWAETAQSNTNGPGIAYAGYLRVRDATTAGALGSTYGLTVENQATSGLAAYGVNISTVAGATNVYPINITHASTLRLRMDGTGNVGIGSAVSIAGSVFVRDLTVNTSIQSSGTLTVNALVSNVYGLFGQNVTINSANASTTTTTGALIVAGGAGVGGNINVGGATNYFVGNVGIGTTNPISQLHVTTDASAANRGLTVSQHITGAPAALINFRKSRGTISAPTTVANGDYTGAFSFLSYDGTAYRTNAGFGARINGTVASNSVPTDLYFYAGATDDVDPYNNNTVRMVIANTGRVGIGTTAPTAVFEAVANSAVSTSTGISIRNRASTNNHRFELGVGYPGYYDDAALFRFANNIAGYISSTGQWNMLTDVAIASNKVFVSLSSGSSRLNLYDASGNTNLSSLNALILSSGSGTERMRIDSTGRVGIGTTTPGSTLDVNGIASFRSAISVASTATVGSLTSNGTITGTGLTVTSVQNSGTTTVQSLNSNTNVVATNIQSTGQASVASLVSNGAVGGTTGTFTGALYGATFNTAGTATVNALVSNGAITGTTITGTAATFTSSQNSGNERAAEIVSNTWIHATQNLTVASSNTSTSTTTGAAVITGGVGIGGNLNVGGTRSLFTGRVGVGTTNAATVSNTFAVFGSTNITGNIVLTNPAGGTGGVYFPDGSYQTTAVTNQVMSSYEYTGNGTTTVYSTSPSTANGIANTIVFVNGVYQLKDAYTWSGTSITFVTPPPQYSLISINIIGSVSASSATSIIGVTTVTGNTTLLPTTPFAIVSGNSTVTLPSAATSTGQMYYVKNVGTGNVVVTTINNETIDGNSSLIINSQWSTAGVLSNGTNWFIF